MPDQLQLRGGTTAQHTSFTGASKEVTVDTTKKTAVVHDGSTVGGVPLLREDGSNSALTLGSAGTPSIKFTGDTNTGIYSPGADQVAVATNGNARLYIASDGKVGIGTTGPSSKLHVRTADNTSTTTEVSTIVRDNSGYFLKLYRDAGSGNPGGLIGADSAGTYYTGGHNTQNMLYIDSANNVMQFFTNNGEKARIDSSGRLLVGTSTTQNIGSSVGARIEASEVGASLVTCSLRRHNNANTTGPLLNFGRSRGTTEASATIVQDNDELGLIRFAGADGVDIQTIGAVIGAYVDGTPGVIDMPGRLVFSTTADGAASPTERMRINSGGNVLIGKTTAGIGNTGVELRAGNQDALFTNYAATAVFVNRLFNDGTLIDFLQHGTSEGTISVSGTTVSYNGAHLSRWSQLPSGAERTEILRGTVLSNIDEMCEWGKEDNEQLNRMKVSDVEGDKNVSGVFQCWDDDDDTYTNDFYCAMTGDFIIRIAEGITIERGDLLMSAGDGTAKPQDDDIIRSKTIAKVTSTNVSCTYEDGSYCVPCVLMAC